ncbi:MAG: hypothetical protein WBS54_14935 [Acidobacteriota bacterium]
MQPLRHIRRLLLCVLAGSVMLMCGQAAYSQDIQAKGLGYCLLKEGFLGDLAGAETLAPCVKLDSLKINAVSLIGVAGDDFGSLFALQEQESRQVTDRIVKKESAALLQQFRPFLKTMAGEMRNHCCPR